MISTEDIESGKWRFNHDLAAHLDIDAPAGQAHLRHYAKQLYESGKYDLTIWPYHAMLGGIGHALVAAVEEAIFFHTVCRVSQPVFQIKGDNPLTENYSVLRPEIQTGVNGTTIAEANTDLVDKLLSFDAIILAGQAKSHCVAWTLTDLLDDIKRVDANLAQKIYLLEDCTSPVVIPGVIDYSAQADQAFRRFAEAGMHIVRSTDPIDSWPGFGQQNSG
jgi:nicotinamidase-related amidase